MSARTEAEMFAAWWRSGADTCGLSAATSDEERFAKDWAWEAWKASANACSLDACEYCEFLRRPCWRHGPIEVLAEQIRIAWVKWAKDHPNPKPSWLVPWAECDEETKDADRAIARHLLLLPCEPQRSVSA